MKLTCESCGQPVGKEHFASVATRNHYFARLRDLWLSLPEDISEDFPSVDHLRKWALIKSGYHDRKSMVCSSQAEARRIAAFVKPADDFAIVVVTGTEVAVYTARSQKRNAMTKQDFADSKEKVLALIEDLIGVSPSLAPDQAHEREAVT